MNRLSFAWLIAVVWLSAGAYGTELVTQDQYADFGGVKVHYKEASQVSDSHANALVFIHGWACSADFWKQSIDQFPEYRVIAIDLPGHGRSDKPQIEYTMDYFAKSIAAVLRHAKVEEALLVGHSMGTPVIRQFYRHYPQQTLGLVVVDGALQLGPNEEMLRLLEELRLDYASTAARSVDAMLAPMQDAKLKQNIRAAMLATPGYVGLSASESLMDEKIWTHDAIKVPVLAILAQSTGWKSDTEASFRLIAPKLEFYLWKGVSHFLMMERPEEFNGSLRRFIARNGLLRG